MAYRLASIILLLLRTVQLLALGSFASFAMADYQPDTELCPASPGEINKPLANKPVSGNKTVISADDSSAQGNIFKLEGNVVITDRDKKIKADHISYDNVSGKAILSGNISLESDVFRVSASQGEANTRENSAEFSELEYRITQFSGRGKAETAIIHNKNTATLKKLTYTTCPDQKQDWVLKADKMRFDQDDETAKATNVSVWFKDFPLMYLPQFSFPTGDKRKSGFLSPTLGQSSKTGTELWAPWYWNIAPDRDATIGLHQMSKRGSQLYGEYRHLHKMADSKLAFDYLKDDSTRDDRFQVSFLHNGKLADRWKLAANLKHVSDQQYFNDLGENLEASNVTHVPRYIEATKSHELGLLLIRAHEFQSINVSDTYQRLPQIALDLESSDAHYNLQAELTRFDHRDDVITGTRLDLSPGIQYEWSDDAYYIRPAARLRHTRYHLLNTSPGQDKQLARTTPIFSLDSGLFFERPVQLWNQSQTLTLEPRIFYLYSSFDNQDNIPVFDTTIPDFRFAGLFRTNRFTGPDRQSDANQLTLALSSRLIDDQTNRERLRFSIGQSLYFQDREVNLPGNSADSGDYSEFTGELEGQFTDNSQFRVSGLWDPNSSQINKAVIAYGYQRDDKHLVNLNYRYQRNLFEQTELSARWRLGVNWNGFAGWTYSLQDRQSIESLAGLEYDSCCWSIQVGARRYLNNNGIDMENSVYIQLNLKGMTNIGGSIDTLSDTRLGYRTRSAVQ